MNSLKKLWLILNRANTIITLSFAIFAYIGYVSSYLFNNLPISVWQIILLFSILFSYLLLRSTVKVKPKITSGRKLSFAPLIPFAVFIPGFLSLVMSTRHQVSVHGPFHIAYVYQLISGVSPPHNVGLPGFAANTYWPFHALLAVISSSLQIAPPQAQMLLNFWLLLSSLLWIRRILKVLGVTSPNKLVTSLLAIFSLFAVNLFGSIHFLLRYLQDTTLNSIDNARYELAFSLVTEKGYRAVPFAYIKYLNFNGFPVGIIFLLTSLYAAVRIISGKASWKEWILLLGSIIGALLLHSTTGVFLLIGIPVALVSVLLLKFRKKKGTTAKNLLLELFKQKRFFVFLVCGVILFIPAGIFVVNSSMALPAESEVGYNYRSTLMFLTSFYPLIPLFVLSLIEAKKRHNFPLMFVGIASLLGSIFASFTFLPDGNEYKFSMIAGIAMAITAAPSLLRLFSSPNLWKKIFVLFFLGLVLINITLIGLLRILSPWMYDTTYQFDKTSITVTGSPLQVAHNWIAANTPSTAVVVGPWMLMNTSETLITSQRLSYVTGSYIYVQGIPEFSARRDIITQLFADDITKKQSLSLLKEISESLRQNQLLLLVPKQTTLFEILSVVPEHVYEDDNSIVYELENLLGHFETLE